MELKRSLSSEKGTLWLEAAVLTPIMLMIVVGTAEIGNFFVQRTSVTNMAHAIAMAIQQKPDITAEKMYQFQKSLGGVGTPFNEVRIKDGSRYAGNAPCSVKDCRIEGLEIRIGAAARPVHEPDIRTLVPSDWSNPRVGKKVGANIWGTGGFKGNASWPNSSAPFEADPDQDPSDDSLNYYVGVRLAWQNRPLFRSLGFAAITTVQFAGVTIKPEGPASLMPHLEMLPDGSYVAVGGDIAMSATQTSREADCEHSISICGQSLGYGGSVTLRQGQICEVGFQFSGECSQNSVQNLGRTDRAIVSESFRGGSSRWTIRVEDKHDWDWNDSVWEIWGTPVSPAR